MVACFCLGVLLLRRIAGFARAPEPTYETFELTLDELVELFGPAAVSLVQQEQARLGLSITAAHGTTAAADTKVLLLVPTSGETHSVWVGGCGGGGGG